MSPSISAFGVSAATESTTIRSIAARAHQLIGDLERLLAVVRLRHQQLLETHAEPSRVLRIERVLGVDERAGAAQPLRLGDRVQRQRRLARRLGAEDLDDPAARQPADAERHVERQRSRRDDLDVADVLAPSSGMIAPLPNCFSMAAMAACTAFKRSLVLHGLPLVVVQTMTSRRSSRRRRCRSSLAHARRLLAPARTCRRSRALSMVPSRSAR